MSEKETVDIADFFEKPKSAWCPLIYEDGFSAGMSLLIISSDDYNLAQLREKEDFDSYAKSMIIGAKRDGEEPMSEQEFKVSLEDILEFLEEHEDITDNLLAFHLNIDNFS